MIGRSPLRGSGHSPKGGAAISVASPAKPSVPNADEFDHACQQEAEERDDEAALYREADAEEIRCALALFRSLRGDFNQYRAVKVDGTFNWTITKPRSPEALLAALETDEPVSPFAAAQPLVKRLNNWERFWTNRYRHSPPDGKRIEVRVGDLRDLRQALASAMSAFGQDPEEGLEAKPASATGEAGDAQPSGSPTPILPKKERPL